MVEAKQDHLTELLEDGWSIEGYSNTMIARGAMTYSVLLRKANQLTAITIVRANGQELGRTINQLAPIPGVKKRLI